MFIRSSFILGESLFWGRVIVNNIYIIYLYNIYNLFIDRALLRPMRKMNNERRNAMNIPRKNVSNFLIRFPDFYCHHH